MDNGKIRFGIIGRNFIVDMMMEAMAAVEEAEPAAIYSRDPQGAAEFAQKYGLKHIFTSLEDMAASPEIDAVYIASPNSIHYEQAKLMLSAGKHVLCEKPAVSNAAQLRALLRTASEHGVVFLEAMRPIFANFMRILQRTLPQIGKLRQIAITYCKTSSRYQRFLAEGNAVNTFNPELSNAAVMDLGCYGIHPIVTLFGKPESVSAHAVHLKNGFEALGTVVMEYRDFLVTVTYSKVSNMNLPVAFSGEKGVIYLDAINHARKMWMQMNGEPEKEIYYVPMEPNDMVFELRAFHRFISGNTFPVRENWNSVIVAEILDEVRRQTGTEFPADSQPL